MFPHGQVAAIAGTVGLLDGKRAVTDGTAPVLERLALEYGPNRKKVTAKRQSKTELVERVMWRISAACPRRTKDGGRWETRTLDLYRVKVAF